MTRQQLTCQILGHRYDPDGEAHGFYDCERCGSEGYDPQSTLYSRLDGWLYWKRYRLRQAWHSFKRWVRCGDCGRWCGGKHSDTCLPF